MYHLSLNKLGFQRDDRFLFRGLDFAAKSGEVIQFVGANGSGKTTLMKIVVGLIDPSEGKVQWENVDDLSERHQKSGSSDSNTSIENNTLCHSLLYLGHDSGVKLSLTAIENLRWYFGINGKKVPSSKQSDVVEQSPSDESLMAALKWAGLRTYENVICHEMSAGQRRRVALARLYLSRATLWVLDEPFTAIDTAGVVQLESQIAEHAARGGIVLMTTHQTSALDNVRVLDLSDFKAGRTRTEREEESF